MIPDEELRELVDLPVFPFAPVSVPKPCTPASPPSAEPAEETSSGGERCTAAGARPPFPGCCKEAWSSGAMMYDLSCEPPERPLRASDINLCPWCGAKL